MAAVEINKNPSRRDLLIFGLLFVAFAGILGAVAQWRWHAPTVARGIWAIGAVISLGYFLVPPLRRPIYLGWVYLTFPIGFVVSHILLAIVFYAVVTPIGLILRLLGRDPMKRKFDPSQKSYWIPIDPDPAPERYFRQY